MTRGDRPAQWQETARAGIDAACDGSDVADTTRDVVEQACRALPADTPAPMFTSDDEKLWALWNVGRYHLEIGAGLGTAGGKPIALAMFERDDDPATCADVDLSEGLWVFAIVMRHAQREERELALAFRLGMIREAEECERIADAEERGEIPSPPLHRARSRGISGDGT